jgi:alpha-amylase
VIDLPEGGRPLFFHEVIDMGGEAIKAQEYLAVGKITEFRYGIKLAQCIRAYDFNCLGGIYDPVSLLENKLEALFF